MAVKALKIIVINGGRGSGGGLFDQSEGGGSGKKTDPAKEAMKQWKASKIYKMLNYNQSIRAKIQQKTSPAAAYAIQSGIGLAWQTAKQYANYRINDIGRKNGDSNYQAIVQRRIEQVTDPLGVLGGALSGAAAGSAAGLPGAIAGAVIGAAGAGIDLGFKYAERERAYQHEMFKESTSQAYNLARANYSALTGRVR
jgi:hypothetical protein